MHLQWWSRGLTTAALIASMALPGRAFAESSLAPCVAPTVADGSAVAVPGGNGANNGSQPGPMPATAPGLCWTGVIGNPVAGASVGAVGDLVISSTDSGALVAFGPDGAERWRYQAGESAHAVRGMTLGADTAFITTPVGFVALAVADGSERWHLDLPQSAGIYAQVVDAIGAFWLTSAGQTLVATTVTYAEDGTQSQALVAVDAATGTQLWRAPLPAEGIAGAPATDGTIVTVTGGDGALYAFDLDTGTGAWSVAADALWPSVATNLAFTSGDLLVGLGDSSVVAIKTSDGSGAWHSATLDPAGGTPLGLLGTADAAYLDTGPMLVAIDPVTGATPWGVTIQASAPMFPLTAIPAIVDGTIVVGTTDGMDVASLVAVSTAGTQIWRTPTELYGAIMSPVVLDGRVYAAAYGIMDGGLLAFGTP